MQIIWAGHPDHSNDMDHKDHLDHLGHLDHMDHLGHLDHMDHLGHPSQQFAKKKLSLPYLPFSETA